MNKKVTGLLLTVLFLAGIARVSAQEVVVVSSPDEIITWFQSQDWWGEPDGEQQFNVPYALITSIGPNWRTNASELPVQTKKAIFYRVLLPLVLHANQMILDRRDRLAEINLVLGQGELPPVNEVTWLAEVADVLRIADIEDNPVSGLSLTDLQGYVSETLYRLDIIPAGLALGQAAYESGYGTSRFAAEGNSLFGQWTFGGDGLVPEEQRGELGDHRIAAFDWPFDSVRSYFINLNSHPAYEEFRSIRAGLREQGLPIDSMSLANGLIRYSERGQEYVDTLKSIIRVNNLHLADDARFRDKGMSFIVGAQDQADAERIREEIESMRESGELGLIIEQMALE